MSLFNAIQVNRIKGSNAISNFSLLFHRDLVSGFVVTQIIMQTSLISVGYSTSTQSKSFYKRHN